MSLEGKKITVDNLRSYVQTLPAFKCASDDKNSMPKLLSKRKEIKNAVTINNIIDLISTEYASFLDYDIFQCIVREYRLDEGQEQLQYPQYLKAYVEAHKVAEFLEINPALEKYHSAKELVLKFDIDLSICNLATILDLKNTVADILGMSSLSLRLLNIKQGCVLVTFLIPESVASVVFARGSKFNSKQVKGFQDMSLIWMKCNGRLHSFRPHSDTEIAGLACSPERI